MVSHTGRIAALLALGLASLLTAQRPGSFDPDRLPAIGVVKGTVVDSTSGLPIPYASVYLVRLRDNETVTGRVTDSDGAFHVSKIPLGAYQVVVEFIGYERKIIEPIRLFPQGDGIEQNMGEIKLKQTAIPMQAVDVEGDRPLFLQTVEKRVFNVEQNTLTVGGTALDALRQVPGVDVDIDGNISLRGSANVKVLIDGKPSTLTGSDRQALLENVPADNIRDIEVITNPSVKYDPEGMAGILNIVLKENRLEGLNGNMVLRGDGNGGYTGSGQINSKNEKINWFTNTGLRHDVRGGGGDNYRETILSDLTSILDQEIDGERGGNNVFINSGVEFSPAREQTVGLKASFSDGKFLSDRTVHTNETIDTLLQYSRISEEDRDRENLDLTLTYDRAFSLPRQKLSAAVHRSTGQNRESELFWTRPLKGYEGLVDTDPEKISTDVVTATTNIKVDYIHPMGANGKFELGYDGSVRLIDNRFFTYELDEARSQYVADSTRSNHFLFDENIHALYAQYSMQKKMFGFQVGLRGETVNTFSELETTHEVFKNPYTSLFPSASISVGPPQILQVQASYGRRIDRPSYRQLNPSIFQFDQSSIYTGNPFLKPEYIDVLELNLSRFTRGLTLSLGSYYRRTTDKMNRYKYVGADGVSVLTYENFNQVETYGLEFILSGPVLKDIRVMFNGNTFRDQVNASNVFEDYDRTSSGVMSRFTVTWSVYPSLEIMFMGFYRGPRDIPIGRIRAMSFSSLSVKKRFLSDRMAVTFQMNDPFNTMGFHFLTWGDNYFQEGNRKWDSRIASLSLEYRFGKLEDRSRRRDRDRNGSDMDQYEIE